MIPTALMPAMPPIFVGSEVYRGSSYGARHPLRVPRVSTVMDLSRALGLLPPDSYRTSPRAKAAALTLWHDPDYITALQQAEVEGQVSPQITARHGLGTLSNPIFPEMFRRPATGAGGVMWAAETLAGLPAGAIHVPGGGTHHGMRDRANGFCYLNDPVLGILTARRAGLARVAYVDIDAHHADGVEAGLAGDPSVLLISVHEENRWPFTGALTDDGGGNVFNLPVPRGFNDTEMRAVLEGLILPRVAEFKPDLIVLQAGADAVSEDPLSRLALSNNAHRAVLAGLRPLAPRFLLLGGGGYNPWTVGRLWTLLWADLLGQTVPDVLPDAAQAVLSALSWQGGGRAAPAPTLLTQLQDAPRAGPVRPDLRDRLARLAAR
ncbi:acetoin utilization protein AcuC [Tabrizicola sp.]|uniref:acetoin utilization protein AcuC n=1 Tax=Tabrizicola sp. TaxID=2005166 RepID=UPI003D293037